MLASWEESYDKPRECIKKQRHHFANKGPYSQSYGFSRSQVQMCELDHKEDWAWRNWCFQTVVLEKKLLRAPWTARRSNQSTLKEINPEYSLEGLLLKPQYFGHLMCRAESLKQTLTQGKIEGRGIRGWQRIDGEIASPTQWTWFWANSGRQWRTEEPGLHTVHGVTKKCTQLGEWTTTTWVHNLGRESVSYSSVA